MDLIVSWPSRDLKKHKDTCTKLKACKTLARKHAFEVQTGIKYSILVELEYFDPIRFTIVDPMHNLFLGTAKTVLKQIWIKRGIIQETNFPVLQTRVDSMTIPSIGRIPHKILSSFGSFTGRIGSLFTLCSLCAVYFRKLTMCLGKPLFWLVSFYAAELLAKVIW